MLDTNQPLIPQRADPYMYLHSDGFYYFTASVPAYDGIELRRSETLEGLASATPVMVWRKPDTGPYCELIWAPEIHFIDGEWVVYFAAAPSRAIKDQLFQHRMYALTAQGDNPLTASWQFAGQVDSGIDTFCLDASTFTHQGKRYYLWAQKDNAIRGNSNLYIAELASVTTLKTPPVRLSIPEFDWEIRGFWVNEGPALLRGPDKLFIAYSASATDENYCMGLLWADANADLLNPASWHKSPSPVLTTNAAKTMFGPGHNSFTKLKTGEDVLVYHARQYTEIEGDPLWNPDRHTFIKLVRWDEQGMPIFGRAGEPA